MFLGYLICMNNTKIAFRLTIACMLLLQMAYLAQSMLADILDVASGMCSLKLQDTPRTQKSPMTKSGAYQNIHLNYNTERKNWLWI